MSEFLSFLFNCQVEFEQDFYFQVQATALPPM